MSLCCGGGERHALLRGEPHTVLPGEELHPLLQGEESETLRCGGGFPLCCGVSSMVCYGRVRDDLLQWQVHMGIEVK